MSYLATRLTNSHSRENFNCGKPPLDGYIRNQVSQDIRKRLTACFVVVDEENFVKGYYTLSNSSIPKEEVPEDIFKRIPKAYAGLPVTLLGRLAVDLGSRGQRLGEDLLLDALKRSFIISEEIASMAVIVDPLDEEAVSFYKKYGFVSLESGKMFIPMKTIEKLFNEE